MSTLIQWDGQQSQHPPDKHLYNPYVWGGEGRWGEGRGGDECKSILEGNWAKEKDLQISYQMGGGEVRRGGDTNSKIEKYIDNKMWICKSILEGNWAKGILEGNWAKTKTFKFRIKWLCGRRVRWGEAN